MKKNVLTSLLMVFSAMIVMASSTMETPSEKLREQIIELLESPKIEFDTEIISANINFTLNQKGEIVILTIDTNNPVLERYIKNKLNYKKIFLNGLTTGKEFQIIFKVKQSVV